MTPEDIDKIIVLRKEFTLVDKHLLQLNSFAEEVSKSDKSVFLSLFYEKDKLDWNNLKKGDFYITNDMVNGASVYVLNRQQAYKGDLLDYKVGQQTALEVIGVIQKKKLKLKSMIIKELKELGVDV